MKPRRFLIVVVAALLPFAAAAQEAHTTKSVNVRAGPARDYPLVASFGPGTPLAVQGCTEGYGWCDVVGPGDLRGWVFAGNIAYPYQNADVPVIEYGPSLGFPIVTFTLGSYWGQYYRNRPWFGNQGRWLHHRPPLPPRPGIRPPRPGVRPPISSPRPPGVRPPIARPPGGQRPPSQGRPPSGSRPPGGPRAGARTPEHGRPAGGEPGRAAGGEPRSQQR